MAAAFSGVPNLIRDVGAFTVKKNSSLLTTMAEIKQPVSSQPQVSELCNGFPMDRGANFLFFFQGIPPMQVGGNKNAKNCPIGPDGRRDWSFGLFDCFGRCGLCT